MTRLSPAKYCVFAIFMVVGICCFAKEKREVRHSEENAKYSLKVINDQLIVTQKSNHKTGVIGGIPYDGGRHAYNYLPDRMLSPDGDLVVFPIGNAYLMVDLQEYFQNKCKLDSCNGCLRLVGGGPSEGELNVARGDDYFRVGGVLSDNLIEGYVNAYGDGERGAKWYLKLEDGKAILADEYFKDMTLREESYNQYREHSFWIVVDAKEFARLETSTAKSPSSKPRGG